MANNTALVTAGGQTTAAVLVDDAAPAGTLRVSSTGLAVTGTLSATGAMIMSTTATPTGTATNDWRRVALVDF